MPRWRHHLNERIAAMFPELARRWKKIHNAATAWRYSAMKFHGKHIVIAPQ
jgi:hypothetical protein